MILPTVLMISDDSNILALFTYVLEKKRYSVRSANKTVEAWAACLRQPPDLVIIHYSSIGEPPDGPTFCHQVRGHPVLRTIPIIVISAQREEAVQAGASAYFDIVFDIEKVLAQVATLLAQVSDSS